MNTEPEETVLTITTTKPEKWVIVDTETGQAWRWSVDRDSWYADFKWQDEHRTQ